MKRHTILIALAAVALLAAFSSAQDNNDNPEWSRPPTPVNPLQVDKPKNWTQIGASECPKDCTVNGCCTQAWDQLTWMMLSMPKANCSFCKSLRYSLGTYKPDNKTEKCAKCLMNDFKNMVSQFKCNNDNGKCSKCCMDLTIIYMARFVFDCPDPVWKRWAEFNYKDTGFSYDGSSSCPVTRKKRNGEIDPYDYSYFDSLDPNDQRRKVDYPRRVGETKNGKTYYDYGYQEVNGVGVDVYG